MRLGYGVYFRVPVVLQRSYSTTGKPLSFGTIILCRSPSFFGCERCGMYFFLFRIRREYMPHLKNLLWSEAERFKDLYSYTQYPVCMPRMELSEFLKLPARVGNPLQPQDKGQCLGSYSFLQKCGHQGCCAQERLLRRRFGCDCSVLSRRARRVPGMSWITGLIARTSENPLRNPHEGWAVHGTTDIQERSFRCSSVYKPDGLRKFTGGHCRNKKDQPLMGLDTEIFGKLVNFSVWCSKSTGEIARFGVMPSRAWIRQRISSTRTRMFCWKKKTSNCSSLGCWYNGTGSLRGNGLPRLISAAGGDQETLAKKRVTYLYWPIIRYHSRVFLDKRAVQEMATRAGIEPKGRQIAKPPWTLGPKTTDGICIPRIKQSETSGVR